MADDKGTAYSWDEPAIPTPKEGDEYILLPPGDYNFTVKKFERSHFAGSDKMNACPMAIMHLEINAGELGDVIIQHRLFLSTKTEGINCSFFHAIGLRKKGDPLLMAWNQTIGRRGRCKIARRTYEDKEFNDIKKFYTPDEGAAGAAATAPADQGEMPW